MKKLITNWKLIIGVLICLSIMITGCVYEPLETDLQTRNIFPITNNAYDIGSLALQYDDGYFQNLFVGGVPVVPGGGGDVVGTPPSTDDAIARYDGITGLLIQNSGVTISDAGVISGGSLSIPTGRCATLIVAASDSSAKSIAQSDYQCDGAADDVQINAALNALPVNGGQVLLLEGTYVLADPIVIPKDFCNLSGQGASSFIDGDGLANNEHAIYIAVVDVITISNLSIQTEDGGGKVSSCIFIEDSADEFLIKNVVFWESDSNAIHIGGTSIDVGSILNCYIADADEMGIYVDMDGGNTFEILTIANNTIERVDNDGIRVWNTGTQDYFVINSNIISGVGGNAIYLQNLQGSTITDNNIENPDECGIRINNTDYNTFTGNSVYNSGTNGFMSESSDHNTITGNNIDTTQDADASDCIQIEGNNNVINGNTLKTPERNGVRVAGDDNIINNNVIVDPDWDGIDISGTENIITGNLIDTAGHAAADTYDGITLDGSSDRCSIIGNTIVAGGTITENGIHINDGVTEVKISDNYIFNLRGSGIVLVANNDDCQITDNYVQQCDDYGVYIVAATCDDTSIMGNTLQGNGIAEYLDNGTDTKLGGGYTEGAGTYHDDDQTIANATITALAQNGESWDTDTCHDNSTNNSRLTCKTAGKYVINAQLIFYAHNNGERGIYIRQDGSQYLASYLAVTGTSPYRLNVSVIADLAVNEYVEMLCYQSSGGYLDVYAQSAAQPMFMMQRIGQ